MSKRKYYALLKPEDDAWLVSIPDLGIYTQGVDRTHAIVMGMDALRAMTGSLLDSGKPLPDPSNEDGVMEKARQDADEDLDFTGGEIVPLWY